MNSQRRGTQGKVWKGPEYRRFVPVELGCTPSWYMDLFTSTDLSTSQSLGILMEASSHRHD